MTDAGLVMPRAQWHTRASTLVFAWLGAAVVLLALRLEDGPWLVTHALLLGAVTNALFIWSWHFTCAVLRVPAPPDRSAEIMRLAFLNVGAAGVIIGAGTETAWVVVLSMLLVTAAVALLGRAVIAAARRALASPYAFTATAYAYACSLLVPGLFLGAIMETVDVGEALEAQLKLAHIAINLLGWVGIPILGTIVTLWPTMLRTRIAPNAARLGRRVLPVLAASAVVAAIGFAVASPWLAGLGLVAYAAAFVVTARPMMTALRAKPAGSFATRSALAGMVWLFVALVLTVAAVWRWGLLGLAEHGAGVLVLAAVGGVLQVLLGCLSYLLPAMAAGGPAKVRWRNHRAERLGAVRLVITNLGVVLTIAVPDGGRVPALVLLVVGFVATSIAIASTLRGPSSEEIERAEAGLRND